MTIQMNLSSEQNFSEIYRFFCFSVLLQIILDFIKPLML